MNTNIVSIASLLLILGVATHHTQAALLAYEDFNISSPLHGSDGGTGWDSAWYSLDTAAGTATSIGIANGSLSYGSLPTSGNRAHVVPQPSNNLFFTRDIVPISDGDVWVSALVQMKSQTLNSQFILASDPFGPFPYIFFGRYGSTFRFQNYSKTTVSIAPADDEAHFIVFNLDWSTQTAYLFLDPEISSSSPGTPTANIPFELGYTFDHVTLFSARPESAAFYDEIRIGTAFADVIPEPSSTVLTFFGLALAFRRTRRIA